MISNLPHDQHVARFCAKRHFDEGEVQASAFHLRTAQSEEYLSVNWVEHLGSTIEEALPLLHGIYSNKKLLKNVAGEHVAILNVERTISHVSNNTPDSRKLSIREPSENEADKSHYGIFNMIPNEVEIAEEIKASVVRFIPVTA